MNRESKIEKILFGIKNFIIVGTLLITVISLYIHFIGRDIEYIEKVNYVSPFISIFILIVSEVYAKVEEKVVTHNCINSNVLYSSNAPFLKSDIQDILSEVTGNYSNNCLPAKSIQSSIIDKRNQGRIILIAIVSVMLSILFIISGIFHFQYFFVSSVCAVSIMAIYIDYFSNVRRYAQEYDKRFIQEDEKPNTTRGLARIYFEEYINTKFNRDSNFYKSIEKKAEHSYECKKHILRMSLDHTNNIDSVLGVIVMGLNIMLLFPATEEYLVNFIYINKDFAYILFSVLAYGLSASFCGRGEKIRRNVKKALLTYISNQKKFEKQFSDNSDLFNSLIKCRGIYQYTMQKLDEGLDIERIDWKDRMLFIHRMYTHVSRLNITMFLGCGFCLGIFIQAWGFQLWHLFYIILMCILWFLLGKFYLPNAGKKKIVKWCERLIGEYSCAV